MSYIVIEEFADKTDEFRAYLPGAEFPRKGLDVSEARIKELSTDANALHKPLIKEVAEEKREEPKKAPPKKASKKKEQK
jgi:hypothetical protein